MTRIRLSVTIGAFALLLPAAALAQAQAQPIGASGSAGGSADIEMGATQPSQTEMHAGAVHRAPDPPGHSGDTRIAIQGRLNALNLLDFTRPNSNMQPDNAAAWSLLVPMVTPGVRLLDTKLFLGLGLGLAGIDAGAATDNSKSGWSLSPLASYDIVTDNSAALSLLGFLNLARLSDSESCNSGRCVTNNDHIFGWGAGFGAGVRGLITQGLALGGEFGWGFLAYSSSGNYDAFRHGLFGNIFLEASVGL